MSTKSLEQVLGETLKDLSRLKSVCDDEEGKKAQERIVRAIFTGDSRFIGRIKVDVDTDRSLNAIKKTIDRHIDDLVDFTQDSAREALSHMTRKK